MLGKWVPGAHMYHDASNTWIFYAHTWDLGGAGAGTRGGWMCGRMIEDGYEDGEYDEVNDDDDNDDD